MPMLKTAAPELVLDTPTANAVVTKVWEGERAEDDLYRKACAFLSLCPQQIELLRKEMRSVTRGRQRGLHILTPSGHGRRR